MKNQPHHQNCPFCQWITNKPEYAIEENQSFLSLANISPDSEGHVLIITKEPRTNITELTPKEWDNLLPILQSTTNKITNIFQPQGFNLTSNAGAEGSARQAVFHFHLHVVPERNGNRGVGYLRKPWYIPSPQEYEKLEKSFQTQEGIIAESSQAVAKLIDREQASDKGHIVITSKEISNNDLNQIDSATWTQMGELFRTSVQKITEKLEAKSLRTCLFLGKIGGLNQANPARLQIHLIPRYTAKGATAKEVIPIPPEVLEVAARLRQADSELEKEKIKQLESEIEVPLKN
jgi:diadenosine tetraphosphate (Ap4A) HIT family hydrolase